MNTKISERLAKSRLCAIANVFCRFRPSHICCFILSACLVACTTTTPGILVGAQSEVFSPMTSTDGNEKSVAVFLNWYQGCALGECDTARAGLRDRAAACVRSGLQRVNPDLRAIAGPVELRQDTSALVADPREHGQPDSRFDADLVANLRKEGFRYALVLDISRISKTPTWVTDLDPAYIGLVIRRRARTPVHVRTEAILIELDSRRWLARIGLDFKDTETYAASVALAYFIYPIPRSLRASTSLAALSACEEVGEAVGYLLSGQPGPQTFPEQKRLR